MEFNDLILLASSEASAMKRTGQALDYMSRLVHVVRLVSAGPCECENEAGSWGSDQCYPCMARNLIEDIRNNPSPVRAAEFEPPAPAVETKEPPKSGLPRRDESSKMPPELRLESRPHLSKRTPSGSPDQGHVHLTTENSIGCWCGVPVEGSSTTTVTNQSNCQRCVATFADYMGVEVGDLMKVSRLRIS